MSYKLGSLFDGSGGFPLAGTLCGVEPVWAAEVEPYPIAVTRSRFPNMKHLGDISKIHGGGIEPVDIITFGSPCQDLSVAGKRAGLKHEANGDEETTRSGLFMEAVRIIKEMREATGGQFPRFALWENVPGAFSSNKGEDFRVVCEELIKIVEPAATMPSVPKGGWAYADSYVGDGWSLAYRVFDAQYWGVPQRRRRIHLVADFRGERARAVLFEREGVRGYFAEGRTPWQAAPADAQGRPGADDREGEGFDGYNGDLTGEVSATLGVNCGVSTGRNGVIERGGRQLDAVTYALDQQGGKGGANYAEDVMPTLCSDSHGTPHAVAYSVDQGAGKSSCSVLEDKAPTPATTHGGSPAVAVPYTLKIRCGCEGGGKGALIQEDKSATLATNNDQYLFQPVAAPVIIHQHAQSDRWTLEQENLVQTIPAAMGMGGGHGPLVLDPKPVIPIHDQATRFSGKRGDKADGKGNGLGVGEPGDPMNTLTSGDRHAVAYLASGKDTVGTLMANAGSKLWLGNQEAFSGDYAIIEEAPPIRYIVRRLTPTECARLQGFADWWGIVEQKDSLTEEEYQFWLEVRNTHAAINGKKEQDYTEKQMLTWYNKLWTDSAEYKMWGNGIALPPALYCLQGIVDALNTPEEDDSWLM